MINVVSTMRPPHTHALSINIVGERCTFGGFLGALRNKLTRRSASADTDSSDEDSNHERQVPDLNLVVRDLDKIPRGYPNLAAFSDSHENFMLYRRYGYLQARLLLTKQDELRVLEEQLDAIDEDDHANNFQKLYKREDQGQGRKDLLDQIEVKFYEYGGAHLSIGGWRVS